MLSNKQKDDIEGLIRKVGDECILTHFRKISETDISYKESDTDPVTVTDREAEKLLREGLLNIIPDSFFIGEELYATDKNILSYLKQNNKPVWVVDPIDGTDNFIKGKSGFGIMVCLIVGGEIIASWLYEVTLKCMTAYYAPKFIYENGVEIFPKLSLNRPLSGLIGKKLHKFTAVQKIQAESSNIILGPAQEPSIISYHQMLCGSIDFLIFKVTYPWDHLPGIAILKACGAVVSRWSGEPFSFLDVHEGLIIAKNKEVIDIVLENVVKPLSESVDIAEMKSFRT